jgi:hypothetical protein
MTKWVLLALASALFGGCGLTLPDLDREPAPRPVPRGPEAETPPAPAPGAPSGTVDVGPSEEDVDTGPAKVVVLLLHGSVSGAGEDLRWMDAPEKESFAWRLRKRLRERKDGAPVRVEAYRWQGWDDHAARFVAAKQLRRRMESVGADTELHIVTHGHGGSVALFAAGLSERKPNSITTLGMPIPGAVLRNLRNDRSWHFPVYVPPPPLLRGVTLNVIYSPEDRVSTEGSDRAEVQGGLTDGDNRRSMLAAWRQHHGLAEDVPFVTRKGEVRWAWEFLPDDAPERRTLSKAVWRDVRNVPVQAHLAGGDPGRWIHGALLDPRMGAALGDILAGDDPEATLARRGLDRISRP